MATLTLSVTGSSSGRDGDLLSAAPDHATLDSAISLGSPDATAMNAAVSAAVADGATPTQAHVTAINTAWTAYKTSLATLQTAISTDWSSYKSALASAEALVTGQDAVLMFSSALTKDQTRAAIKALASELEKLEW